MILQPGTKSTYLVAEAVQKRSTALRTEPERWHWDHVKSRLALAFFLPAAQARRSKAHTGSRVQGSGSSLGALMLAEVAAGALRVSLRSLLLIAQLQRPRPAMRLRLQCPMQCCQRRTRAVLRLAPAIPWLACRPRALSRRCAPRHHQCPTSPTSDAQINQYKRRRFAASWMSSLR